MASSVFIAEKISSLCAATSTRMYTKSKLKTDPLYDGVFAEIGESDFNLLDIGCGMGILACYLRERGWNGEAYCLDFDSRKIVDGQKMLEKGDYKGITLTEGDARTDQPEHSGNVTILDILQFLEPEQQKQVLQEAAKRVCVGGKLLIRSGIKEDNWRFRITHLADIFARCTFWMKAAPNHYPNKEFFRKVLTDEGLAVEIKPLWGNTPFNNYLIVAERRA